MLIMFVMLVLWLCYVILSKGIPQIAMFLVKGQRLATVSTTDGKSFNVKSNHHLMSELSRLKVTWPNHFLVWSAEEGIHKIT